MMRQIVVKLGTSFAVPEKIIIDQDSPSTEMFYISSGDCSVNIINDRREE